MGEERAWRSCFCAHAIFSNPELLQPLKKLGVMSFNEQHENAMRRALELALNGPAKGLNPRVGAVLITASGEIVGQGWHRGSGTDHAEVAALKDLQANGRANFNGPIATGLTAVVTLEPCNHTGKTGPCAQALITAGVERVIFATKDPGLTSSGGAATLREAGIEVESGLLEDAAQELIRVWATATRQQRPFVTLKYGSSLDGRSAAADGSSKWITGPEARRDVHRRRTQIDAILVGTGTVIADNPELTARHRDGSLYAEQPIRVILGETELDPAARIFDESEGKGKTVQLRTRDLNSALISLFEMGVRHLMVEGGALVASEFVRHNLVNEYLIYLAPKLIGGPVTSLGNLGVANISQAKELEFIEIKQLGPDLMIRAIERNN
jgi:diaminohydroxyphosphoribosylaminopyrimidine deaminase/5-amino-6-(5-phosphoribosylamino)uracil reductase